MNKTVSFGKGSRPLVIIPGLSVSKMIDSTAILKVIFKQFTKEWKVYVIDRPEEVAEGVTNADLAESYVASMKEMGLTDADVIGVSQGGMIAQYIAIRYPAMVRRLVLGATLSRMNDTFREVLANWVRLAEAGEWYDFNTDTFRKLYTDSFLMKNRLMVAMLSKHLKPANQERFVRLAKACLCGGPYDELKEIKCPVLVMGGENDPVVTGDGSREIAEAIGCELYMFKGLRHAIYDESKEFYERARFFLSQESAG